MKKMLKKILVMVMAFSLTIGTFSVMVFAEDGTGLKVAAEQVAGEPSENAEVNSPGNDTKPESGAEKTYTVTMRDGTSFFIDEAEAECMIEEIIAESKAENTGNGGSLFVPEATPELGTVVASGKCGDNVNWALNTAGTMHIYGSGATWDYRDDNDQICSRPWYNYTQSITSVVFHDGVTAIGKDLFESTSNLKTVSFSGSIIVIDNFAFYNCHQLGNFVLPSGLQAIGQDAFSYNEKITEVTIPGTVYFFDGPFHNCTALKKVYFDSDEIPLIIYSNSPFLYCSSLESIEVSSEHFCLFSKDGVLFGNKCVLYNGETSGNHLVQYPPGKKDESYTVPEGTMQIYQMAFCDVKYLENVHIADSVIDIDICAFASCTHSIKKVYIGENVERIGVEAFDNSLNIAEMIMHSNVKTIEAGAFNCCSGLIDIYYTGTEADRNKITVSEEGNGLFYDACWHYNNSGAFIDVYKYDWFCDSVLFVRNRGIMKGMGGTNSFAPGSPLQREQFAIILYRLENSPSVSYEQKFYDVPAGEWYTDPIIWAYKNGIITGYQNGYFGVGDCITREQFATMLYRYAKNYKHLDIDPKSYADISKFLDVTQVSDWAYEAMSWAVGNGIISGKDNKTRLDPAGNAQRCECAAMIERFMNKYGL